MLVVDDDEDVRELMQAMVGLDGFQVVLAGTAEEAIEKLVDPVDAVVLDLMLPGSSGLEVLKFLRRAQNPSPPVIVVTAYRSHSIAQEVRGEPNVIELVSKPVEQQKFMGLLHRILGTRPPV